MAVVNGSGFRSDVQGLRAIAVLLVVIYHIWPGLVPGGFVGVDVFFVISGYLITSHLRREMEISGSISLKAFYARRVRRLLPAASVVIVVVALATLLIAPRFRWLETAKDIAASTLYIQNWRLLAQSVDYLGAEEAAGPLQHFWSLAIEEQYYIFWPLILLIVGAIFPRNMLRQSMIVVSMVVIGVSLFFSVYLTEKDQSVAYFATHARVWELAIGALLAFVNWGTGRTLIAVLAGYVGLAMIMLSAFLFNAKTAFPGHLALVPAVGAALVIWSGGKRLSHEKLLSLPPFRFLGDISYSLYLWHWPLIIFTSYLLPDGYGVLGGLFLLLSASALSWLSKRYIEDRFRGTASVAPIPTISLGRDWRPSAGGLAIVCMGVSLIMPAGIYAWITKQEFSAQSVDRQLYLGAGVLLDGGVQKQWLPGSPVIPAPELAREDLPSSYGNKCHQSARHVKPKGCDIGANSGAPIVVLVGDSHAANWIPAFEVLGKQNSWRIVSYTKSGCALTLQDVTIRGKPYKACTQWSRAVLNEIARLQPALVVLGRSRGARLFNAASREESDANATSMLVDVLRKLHGVSADVAVLRDTPRMPFDPLLCFEKNEKCQVEQGAAMAGDDPLVAAAEIEGHTRVIDMTDGICTDNKCPVVIGDVLVWRDWHHLTASYVKTLAPILGRALGDVSVSK